MQSARNFLTSRMPHATNTKNASGNQSAASHCLAGRENGRASQNGARPKKQFVPQVRRQNPTYGKEKIAVILKRDHGKTLSAAPWDES